MVSAGGGTCDCGRGDAWRRQGWCSRHARNSTRRTSPLTVLHRLEERGHVTLQTLLTFTQEILLLLDDILIMQRYRVGKYFEVRSVMDIIKNAFRSVETHTQLENSYTYSLALLTRMKEANTDKVLIADKIYTLNIRELSYHLHPVSEHPIFLSSSFSPAYPRSVSSYSSSSSQDNNTSVVPSQKWLGLSNLKDNPDILKFLSMLTQQEIDSLV